MSFEENQQRLVSKLLETAFAPIFFTFYIGLIVIGMPTSSTGVGDVFAYPAYETASSISLYTTGTWVGIFLIIHIAKSMLNSKFGDTFYEVIAGNGLFLGINLALYTYLAHYMFIMLAWKKVAQPLDLYPIASTFLVWLLVQLSVISTYLAFACCLGGGKGN